jgi:hypothetical protein
MVVSFKTREISRDARKLARIPTLIKKINRQMIYIFLLNITHVFNNIH